MKTSIAAFGSVLALVIFGGVLCPSDEDLDILGDLDTEPLEEVDPNQTTHGTTIEFGIDPAIVRPWRLESHTFGDTENIFSGRTTTFYPDGTFSEDYSTETAAGQDCELVGMNSGTFSNRAARNEQGGIVNELLVQRKDPPENITVTCQGEATFFATYNFTPPMGINPLNRDGGTAVYEYEITEEPGPTLVIFGKTKLGDKPVVLTFLQQAF